LIILFFIIVFGLLIKICVSQNYESFVVAAFSDGYCSTLATGSYPLIVNSGVCSYSPYLGSYFLISNNIYYMFCNYDCTNCNLGPYSYSFGECVTIIYNGYHSYISAYGVNYGKSLTAKEYLYNCNNNPLITETMNSGDCQDSNNDGVYTSLVELTGIGNLQLIGAGFNCPNSTCIFCYNYAISTPGLCIELSNGYYGEATFSQTGSLLILEIVLPVIGAVIVVGLFIGLAIFFYIRRGDERQPLIQ